MNSSARTRERSKGGHESVGLGKERASKGKDKSEKKREF